MTRRRLIIHLVTLTSVILLVLIGGGNGNAEPAGEVRSVPVFVQSRPVYSKPSPKPKFLLKTPQQLLKDANNNNQQQENSGNDAVEPTQPDVERITQTVYGFLDFVTTIGNTVMVFTPQTKKVEAAAAAVKPTATSEIKAITVKPTEKPELAFEAKEDDNLVASVSSSSSGSRQPKLISFPEEPSTPFVIEASEVEPQLYGSSIVQVAPPLDIVNAVTQPNFKKNRPQVVEAVIAPSTPDVQIRTQVNVVSSPNLESGEFFEGDIEAEDASSEAPQPPSPPPPPQIQSKPSKGFTLKLTPKHMTPVIVTPAFSVPVVVTAQKVNLPPPPPPPAPTPTTPKSTPNPEEPTGVLNQIYETRVKDGKTTVIETKIIGTYIGTQYARILESTSSVLPKIEATKAVNFVLSTAVPQPVTILAQKAPTPLPTAQNVTPKIIHAEPTTSESDHENDFEQDEPLGNDEQEEQDEQNNEEVPQEGNNKPTSALVAVEPTPTASEEQTLYILPQKETKPEKIYVSPVPGPNAYSRQPQLYVDINPAKSVDVIVTATPTRGKPFRLSNRFSNRPSKNQVEANNDYVQPQEAAQSPEESSSTRGRSRFGRNRGRSANSRQIEEVLPTVSVYSHVISATPTRRFKSGGRTSSSVAVQAVRTKEVSFKTAQANRGGYNPSTRNAVQVHPTSSTSIYRFKLNRPTGRWRFKPSPKPKVNIIKTKEDDIDELENGEEPREKEVPQPTNGPVYYQIDGELQHPEETRTESNELVQDVEPELVPQTLRVSTVTPTDFSDLEKYLEIATIKSPYVFQAGNVKNTRYITITKTFTKEHIQPTLASSAAEATLENILATKPPYEKILEGSSDVATLPVIVLGGDMATPPLETITQSFSTTQLMLKTSILPVLYDGVTTLYTLTQSYFITRLVTAHKTVPPVELFQFVPTKSLTEFNTALQEAGSEHREHLLGSESEDENDTNYEHILAPPDELTSVGSDFDPSSMDEKIIKPSKKESRSSKDVPRGKDTSPNPFASPNSIADPLSSLTGLTPEQLAFIRYFTAQNQQQIPQQQAILPQTPLLPNNNNLFPQFPQQQQQQQQGLNLNNLNLNQPQFSYTSSPVVVDTMATVTETKTLRLLFGAKPTYTVLYSTKVVPTRMTTYVTASVPVKPTAAIQNPFLNPLPFPLAYVG